MKNNSSGHNRISNFNSVNSTIRITVVIGSLLRFSVLLAVIGSHSVFYFVSQMFFLLEDSP